MKPSTLKAMEAVISQMEEEDAGELEKAYRAILKKDPKAFTEKLERLEAEYEDRLGERALPRKRDVGTAKALEIVEGLLKQYAEKRG